MFIIFYIFYFVRQYILYANKWLKYAKDQYKNIWYYPMKCSTMCLGNTIKVMYN